MDKRERKREGAGVAGEGGEEMKYGRERTKERERKLEVEEKMNDGERMMKYGVPAIT